MPNGQGGDYAGSGAGSDSDSKHRDHFACARCRELLVLSPSNGRACQYCDLMVCKECVMVCEVEMPKRHRLEKCSADLCGHFRCCQLHQDDHWRSERDAIQWTLSALC